MAQRSLQRPTQWMVAMSCRRPSLSEPACAWTKHGVNMWGLPFSLGDLPERGPDFSSRLSPEVSSTSGYFRKTVGFEIRAFLLLGELPKAIERHPPVCQLYRWQLGLNMWSSPTTKTLDPIRMEVASSRPDHLPTLSIA